MAERFHIAEWYGRPFLELTDVERLRFADHKVGGSAMTKVEISRLLFLEEKLAATGLTDHQTKRLDTLRTKLEDQRADELPCPFRTDTAYPTCNKAGGVCSLQLVTDDGGTIEPVAGEKSMVRATCPSRFQQDNTVFRRIGEDLLGDSDPAQLECRDLRDLRAPN
ncbi:NotI family restriction endonuclease [Erythrobacter alti]|uniref:NotI family restriction endonuclease n=1 Tax=Erythrobacter alti TaxID=1896145 RepID=UPI0030F4291F